MVEAGEGGRWVWRDLREGGQGGWSERVREGRVRVVCRERDGWR